MWSLDTTSVGDFLDNSRKKGQALWKVQRPQNIVPVLIVQLVTETPIDNIEFVGMPMRMFSILAIVRNIRETVREISYDIEDDSGKLTAVKWLQADKKASDFNVKMNAYARFIGLLREQNDKRYLLIFHMYPLQDLNELTCHFLEVIYIALKRKEKMKSKIKQRTSQNDSCHGLVGNQALIYKIIEANNTVENGIEKSEIKKQIPRNIWSDIDTILEELASEGLIYTCRKDYFKTT
ncbi:replication protein A 32 kDa subunit-like [Augochlora pura]